MQRWNWFRFEKGTKRLCLLLAIAFATVGAAAIYVVAGWTVQRERSEVHRELLMSARLLALQVDSTAISSIAENPQVKLQITKRLRQGMSAAPTLGNVLVVTEQWNGVKPVVSGISQEATSSQTIASPILRHSLRTGLPEIEETGQVLRAYVPLLRSDGRIDSALMVEQPMQPILVREAGFWQLVTAANLLVLILSALFAGLIAQRVESAKPNATQRFQAERNRWILRSGILEVILLGVACTVTVVGVSGHLGAASDAEEANKSASKLEAAQRLRDRLDQILIRGQLTRSDLVVISRYAESAELKAVSAEIASVAALLENPNFDWRPFVGQALRLSSRETTPSLAMKASLTSLQRRTDALLACFGIAACLTLAALILIRAASRQQQELADAVEESTRVQTVYEQLIEEVPIGLFTYRDGKLLITNEEWERQADRQPNETAEEALVRSLHPEDRGPLFSLLENQEGLVQGFSTRFRYITARGEEKQFECRGVPVLDEANRLRHMLAFCADITQSVNDRMQIEFNNRLLEKVNAELQESLWAMVHLLVKAVEAKDIYTAGHSDRVTQYSVKVGTALGLDAADLRTLEMGTRIHDVGKIGVPDAVLNKPSGLTSSEYELVKTHPLIGFEMIQEIPQFAACASIVRWHHERLDGSGYPDGLKGDEIPLLVRIAAVADVFDAITSVRAYKEGKAAEDALDEMREDAAKGLLDLQIVNVLADIVIREGMLPQHDLFLPSRELAS